MHLKTTHYDKGAVQKTESITVNKRIDQIKANFKSSLKKRKLKLDCEGGDREFTSPLSINLEWGTVKRVRSADLEAK